ncbi:MAG: hypothetical protein RBT60_08335 [Candidatus Krumholzibacteria bacterium]|nr:hypothetical protein [Candidatus Krumholzibacteria bacterium]
MAGPALCAGARAGRDPGPANQTAGDDIARAALILKLLAPYVAVGLFWCLAGSAWLAILAYHVQILAWQRGRLSSRLHDLLQPARRRRLSTVALVAVLAGPALYVVLPHAARADLAVWLAGRGLSGWSLLLMLPYYGLVHPVLEQCHWYPLRGRTRLAPLLFAGYHALVLGSLLRWPWLLACLAVLGAAAAFWRLCDERTGSGRVSLLSHLLADAGVIIAAWLRLAG